MMVRSSARVDLGIQAVGIVLFIRWRSGPSGTGRRLGRLDSAGALTWTATGGLPAGVSLSSAGVLSGTPTAPIFTSVNFSMNDGADTVFSSVSLNVYAVQITTGGFLPNATQGASYSMDHSSVVYLMGPDGRFVRPLDVAAPPAAVAQQIREAMTS